MDLPGGIASFIVALEDFVVKYPNHFGCIGVIMTSDEEGKAGKLRCAKRRLLNIYFDQHSQLY